MDRSAEYKDVLQRVQNLCVRQERCISEIRQKLRMWKIDPSFEEDIIAEVIEDKFIDEGRYAIAFVRDRYRINKWGRSKIFYELKLKNIPGLLISEAMEQIDEDEYENMVSLEIRKKCRTIKKTDNYTLKGKLVRFAQSRGIELELALPVINQLLKPE